MARETPEMREQRLRGVVERTSQRYVASLVRVPRSCSRTPERVTLPWVQPLKPALWRAFSRRPERFVRRLRAAGLASR
jgi:hypothetical protein